MATSVASVAGVERAADMLVELNPEDILIDESVNVRPYSTAAGESETEAEEIERLAGSIEAEGQLQPVRVRVEQVQVSSGESVPQYHLIMGHRRVKSIHLINMRNGGNPRKVLAVVNGESINDKDALRQAIHENLQRKNMPPMDMAYNCDRVRREFGWAGVKNTKKVAEFMGVSPATVTQYEKLLKLDADKQKLVNSGLLSADAAMEVQSNVKPEEQAAVIEDAKREQEQAQEEHKAEVAAGKKKGRGKAERSTGQVTVKHIRKASRKRDAMLTQRALTKPEVNEVWEQLRDGQAKEVESVVKSYGYRDGKVGLFIRNFCQWLDGKVKTPTMLRDFEAVCVAAMGKGGLSKGTKDKPVVEKAVKGKAGKKTATGKVKASPKPKK